MAKQKQNPGKIIPGSCLYLGKADKTMTKTQIYEYLPPPQLQLFCVPVRVMAIPWQEYAKQRS